VRSAIASVVAANDAVVVWICTLNAARRALAGSRLRAFVAILFSVCLVTGVPAGAQTSPSQDAPRYSQDELDQLLAPIALYPDQLLAQVLIASTYPFEVALAARFVQQNPGLAGDALDEALAQRNWDPSVQSLAAFPQVLAMMNERLDWTQQLGDAFLADEQRVMDTVQSLRRRAENAGNLYSTPQQTVMSEQNQITIQPTQPDIVYVPVYDPQVIYGPWWAPAYPPWFWYPPPVYGYPSWPVFGIGNTVRRPYELHFERTELYCFARFDIVQFDHRKQSMLLQLIFEEAVGQPCGIYRHIDLFEEIRHSADMVLMPMRHYDSPDLFPVFRQV
jgi:hypothetical protein